jgi:hypothetical protein
MNFLRALILLSACGTLVYGQQAQVEKTSLLLRTSRFPQWC